jgi:hypothetical protein
VPPAVVDAPAVPAWSGAPAVPDGMEGATTGGVGEGGEGDTRCSCRDRVTSMGRGKGEKRWSGGGVWTLIEGDPVGDFGDRRVGGGGAVGDKVIGVGEDGVPTGGEGRVVGQVAGVGLKEGLRAGTGDEARPVGVQESSAHEVGAFTSGEKARDSGVGDRREKSGVFEGKEGIGKVRDGFGDARETGEGKEDVKATIVVG